MNPCPFADSDNDDADGHYMQIRRLVVCRSVAVWGDEEQKVKQNIHQGNFSSSQLGHRPTPSPLYHITADALVFGSAR